MLLTFLCHCTNFIQHNSLLHVNVSSRIIITSHLTRIKSSRLVDASLSSPGCPRCVRCHNGVQKTNIAWKIQIFPTRYNMFPPSVGFPPDASDKIYIAQEQYYIAAIYGIAYHLG